MVHLDDAFELYRGPGSESHSNDMEIELDTDLNLNFMSKSPNIKENEQPLGEDHELRHIVSWVFSDSESEIGGEGEIENDEDENELVELAARSTEKNPWEFEDQYVPTNRAGGFGKRYASLEERKMVEEKKKKQKSTLLPSQVHAEAIQTQNPASDVEGETQSQTLALSQQATPIQNEVEIPTLVQQLRTINNLQREYSERAATAAQAEAIDPRVTNNKQYAQDPSVNSSSLPTISERIQRNHRPDPLQRISVNNFAIHPQERSSSIPSSSPVDLPGLAFNKLDPLAAFNQMIGILSPVEPICAHQAAAVEFGRRDDLCRQFLHLALSRSSDLEAMKSSCSLYDISRYRQRDDGVKLHQKGWNPIGVRRRFGTEKDKARYAVADAIISSLRTSFQVRNVRPYDRQKYHQEHDQQKQRNHMASVLFPNLAVNQIHIAKETHSNLGLFREWNMSGEWPNPIIFQEEDSFVCTFCNFECDYGIYDERVLLSVEFSSGYCQDCHNTTRNFESGWETSMKLRRRIIEHPREEHEHPDDQPSVSEERLREFRREGLRVPLPLKGLGGLDRHREIAWERITEAEKKRSRRGYVGSVFEMDFSPQATHVFREPDILNPSVNSPLQSTGESGIEGDTPVKIRSSGHVGSQGKQQRSQYSIDRGGESWQTQPQKRAGFDRGYLPREVTGYRSPSALKNSQESRNTSGECAQTSQKMAVSSRKPATKGQNKYNNERGFTTRSSMTDSNLKLAAGENLASSRARGTNNIVVIKQRSNNTSRYPPKAVAAIHKQATIKYEGEVSEKEIEENDVDGGVAYHHPRSGGKSTEAIEKLTRTSSRKRSAPKCFSEPPAKKFHRRDSQKFPGRPQGIKESNNIAPPPPILEGLTGSQEKKLLKDGKKAAPETGLPEPRSVDDIKDQIPVPFPPLTPARMKNNKQAMDKYRETWGFQHEQQQASAGGSQGVNSTSRSSIETSGGKITPVTGNTARSPRKPGSKRLSIAIPNSRETEGGISAANSPTNRNLRKSLTTLTEDVVKSGKPEFPIPGGKSNLDILDGVTAKNGPLTQTISSSVLFTPHSQSRISPSLRTSPQISSGRTGPVRLLHHLPEEYNDHNKHKPKNPSNLRRNHIQSPLNSPQLSRFSFSASTDQDPKPFSRQPQSSSAGSSQLSLTFPTAATANTHKPIISGPGVLFCRGCPWRQIDVNKAYICTPCRNTKLGIIAHRHYTFTLLSSLRIPENGYFTNGDEKNVAGRKQRQCMICPSHAVWKCDGCELRACESCEVLLVGQCKGKVETLLMVNSRYHYRNDAFLLRADGGGY
jgi:hypothetical protein